MEKRDVALIIAETRSTFDIQYARNRYLAYTTLIEQLWSLRENLGKDELILGSVTPINETGNYAGWDWGKVKYSWYYQSLIEGYFDNHDLFRTDNSSYMGRCFYQGGYYELLKASQGNRKPVNYQHPDTLEINILSYIKKLSIDSSLQVIEINDYKYTKPLVDQKTLSELNIPLSRIIPGSTKNQLSFMNNTFNCTSSKPTNAGVIDCLERINNHLKEKPYTFVKKLPKS